MSFIPITLRPSAAVVLLREAEHDGLTLCMVRRHAQSGHMPGVYVFPGGTVAASDRELEQRRELWACLPGEEELPLGGGFYAAALRECFEEAGVLLAYRNGVSLDLSNGEAAGFSGYRMALNQGQISLPTIVDTERLTLANDQLLHWSHWVTPSTSPKRFDTHFFLAEMPAAQRLAHDTIETSEGIWITAEDALARNAQGNFPLVYATERQLAQLTGLRTVAEARARFAGRPVKTMRPRIVQQQGEDTIVLDDET